MYEDKVSLICIAGVGREGTVSEIFSRSGGVALNLAGARIPRTRYRDIKGNKLQQGSQADFQFVRGDLLLDNLAGTCPNCTSSNINIIRNWLKMSNDTSKDKG